MTRRARSALVCSLIFEVAALAEGRANASIPVDPEAGILAGYMTDPGARIALPGESVHGGNSLGYGGGLRGGFEFFERAYMGLEVFDTIGGTTRYPGFDARRSALLVGADGGYDVHVAFLTIRPHLVVGEATLRSSFTYPQTPPSYVSTTHVYLEPELSILGNVRFAYAGVSAGALAVVGVDQGLGDAKTLASFLVRLELGARF